MTPRTFEILEREHPVYPGHGIVVAYVIMHVFGTPSEALATTKHGWPEAVGCIDIPGAGDGAHAGCDVIQMMLDGSTPEEAADYADSRWTQSVGPGTGNHEHRWSPGQEQADRWRARFVAKAQEWLG